MVPVPATPAARYRRGINVCLAVVIGLAFVGFALGTRPVTSAPSFSSTPVVSPARDAVPGQTYTELRQRRFGPNHRVTSDLAQLRRGLPSLLDLVPWTDEDRQRSLAARAERRAFDGAPPVIPHVIDEQVTGACLACHERGLVVGGRVAPAISHPAHASCTQCHVPALERPLLPDRATAGAGTSFVGLPSPGRGLRAWTGAPPVLPHTRWMRQTCSSCHGVTGRPGLRTTHPQRQSCEQCHAPITELLPQVLGR